MKCKVCGKEAVLHFGWRAVTIRCTWCGKDFQLSEYLDEITEEMWEKIARRSSNRVWLAHLNIDGSPHLLPVFPVILP